MIIRTSTELTCQCSGFQVLTTRQAGELHTAEKMTTLDGLPTEIITLIAARLEPEAFFHFRLCSRELNIKSLSGYVKSFFETRVHTLSLASLETLVQISKHNTFGPSVRSLYVSLHHLVPDPQLNYHIQNQLERRYSLSEGRLREPPGQTSDTSPKDTRNRSKEARWDTLNEVEYNRHLEEQEAMAKCGLDTAYLTAALARLRNCKTLSLCDDGEAWGRASMRDDTGVWPICDMDDLDSLPIQSRALQAIFAAVCASSLQLTGLSFSFIDEGINPDMLKLPIFIRNQIMLHFNTLIKLELTVSSEMVNGSGVWKNNITEFVGLFATLEEFYFASIPRDDSGRFRPIWNGLNMPHLRVAQFEFLTASEHELFEFFFRHKSTLRKIHLGNVSMVEGGGSLQSLQNTIDESLMVEEFTTYDSD